MRDVYGRFFRNVLYPAYESGLRRRGTLAHLAQYEQDQWLSQDEILHLQWQKLSRLLAHCWNDVPFYRRSWRDAGVTSPGDIRNMEDYGRLPVVTKQDVREHSAEMMAESWRGKLMFKTTGGSTGEPLMIGYTRENYERRNAVMHRGYAWAGAPLGGKALYFWGESLGGRSIKTSLAHAFFNRRLVNVFTMKDEDLGAYVDVLDSYRPKFVVSYVAPVVRIAQWMLDNDRRAYVPDAILCAAEPLYAHQRELIESAFGCPVFNTYGCREVMLIASECERRDGMHINADHLCVQLGSADSSGSTPGASEVLLTDLHNYGMPLMRYANGDLATVRPGTCPCGRGLPIMESVDGRTMDALRTSQGHFVGEYLEYLIFKERGILRFQAVQETIDRIEVTIVRGGDFSEKSLAVIREGMREAFGDCIALDFRFTEDIPLTPSGKLRVAISRLS